MRNLYKFLCLFLVFFLCLTVAFAQAPLAKKKIGIFLWNNDPRYVEGKAIFLEELKKEGFAEPQVEFIHGIADGNKAKALEIAQQFFVDKLDLCVAFGTVAATAMMKEIKDIPLIFALVYDPITAKIAVSWQSSGNNTTGASNYIPMSKVIGKLKEISPVKNLAVLYTPGESNSEIQLKELQKLEGEYSIKVIPVAVANKEEVSLVVPFALEKADAMYITGVGIVNTSLEQIVEIANKAKRITLSHLSDYAARGVTLTVGADLREVFRISAQKAILVLRGAAPSSIPIGLTDKNEVIVNLKSAKAAQINISPEFLKSVTKVIE